MTIYMDPSPDRPCIKCGEMGLGVEVSTGQCLDCLGGSRFPGLRIRGKAVSAIRDQVTSLLLTHLGEINQAYLDAPKELSVSFKVGLAPDKEGGVLVEVGMGFHLGKVKDSQAVVIREDQGTLFEEGFEKGPEKAK